MKNTTLLGIWCTAAAERGIKNPLFFSLSNMWKFPFRENLLFLFSIKMKCRSDPARLPDVIKFSSCWVRGVHFYIGVGSVFWGCAWGARPWLKVTAERAGASNFQHTHSLTNSQYAQLKRWLILEANQLLVLEFLTRKSPHVLQNKALWN